jgi:hypothetical protein
MGFSKQVTLVTLAAAVLGGTAACTGSSTGGTTTSSGGTSSSQASSAAPTTAAATTTAATSSSTNTQSGGGSSASSSSCAGSEIKTALGHGGAATGHEVLTLTFTNIGSRTCTLQGYPGAAVMNGSTLVLNATRTLNGFAGDDRQLTSAPLVTLAPGAVASANLEFVVDNGEPCVANGSGILEVTLPNTTTTTGVKSMTTGTQGVCAGFEIHPVVAGTL